MRDVADAIDHEIASVAAVEERQRFNEQSPHTSPVGEGDFDAEFDAAVDFRENRANALNSAAVSVEYEARYERCVSYSACAGATKTIKRRRA